MKKIVFFIAVAILTITMSLVLARLNSYEQIEDAIVNPDNGDIAYAYYVSEESRLQVCVYDYEGNLLWKKRISSAGGTSMYFAYIDGNLNMYVSRTNKLYVFGRDGTIISQSETNDYVSEPLSYIRSENWKGWEHRINEYEYLHESLGVRYVYSNSPSLLTGGGCRLYIESSDGEEIIIYKDEK